MTKIRSYSGFRSINELDTTGTYLDRNRNKYAQAEYPKFRKMFGKVFKDAPTTSGVDYGLKYEGEDYEFDLNSGIFYEWNVIFPDDFYKHFVSKGENLEEWKKDNENIVVELMDNLNDIRIKAEGGLNRTHFPGGIPNDLKGLGLGYIIYEGLVRYLGYASSRPDASNAAQKVWSQIAEDPDFVVIENSLSYPLSKLDKKSLNNLLTSTKGKSYTAGGPIVVFSDGTTNYVIDGHHRWSQVQSVNPDAFITGMVMTSKVAMDAKEVLKAVQMAILKVVQDNAPGAELPAAKGAGEDVEANLFTCSEESLKKYVVDNVSQTFLEAALETGKIKEDEEQEVSERVFKAFIVVYLISQQSSDVTDKVLF